MEQLNFEALRTLLEAHQMKALRDSLATMNEVDIA